MAFRIFPEYMKIGARGFFYNVIVSPTHESMVNTIVAHKLSGLTRPEMVGAEALCTTITSCFRKTGRITKNLGTIYFHREFLNSEVISHECTHAALWWYSRSKRPWPILDTPGLLASDDEEAFCYALGALVAQIHSAFGKLEIPVSDYQGPLYFLPSKRSKQPKKSPRP